MTHRSPFSPFLQPNAFMLAAMVTFVESHAVVETVESRRLFDRPLACISDAFRAARHVEVRTVMDLVNASHVLDMMVAAGLFGSEEYWFLIEQAKSFLLANPELLMSSWVHRAGAIHDMLEEMRGALPTSGVSGQSIYKWEQGGTRPRAAQIESLAKVRALGKREARARLEE